MAFAPHHDVFRALHKARIATRRGDARDAKHWMKIADAHLLMAQRLEKLRDVERARAVREEEQFYIFGELAEVREYHARQVARGTAASVESAISRVSS